MSEAFDTNSLMVPANSLSIHQTPGRIPQVTDIPVETIVVRDRLLQINKDNARALAESMDMIGLMNPITVYYSDLSDVPVLVAGLHRLEAAKTLGWETIACFVVPGDDADLLILQEIDENLARGELGPSQRAKLQKRRKEVYERLYPGARHGGDRKSSRVLSVKRNK